VTFTVNVKVPDVVGVPLIMPVLGAKVNPVGSDPVEIDQL
jgi:hypothetical protein